jgi:hypothetical protein
MEKEHMHLGTQLEYLGVKAQNLADEARDIRRRELKWARKARMAALKQKSEAAGVLSERRLGLYNHRIRIVRPEARATHLARAFMRNLPYEAVERTVTNEGFRGCHTSSISVYKRAIEIVTGFTGWDKADTREGFLSWLNKHPKYRISEELFVYDK